MIPRPYIAKWQQHAPWKDFSQVEQDLIISRTLVEIFSDDFLRENLAFRGGTALHKLFLKPAAIVTLFYCEISEIPIGTSEILYYEYEAGGQLAIQLDCREFKT